MRRRQMMQKVSRISLCVVIGLLFLALIWKFAGAQLAKKGIVLSNDTAAKTVSETAPEAEDGSGNAGIKKLAETTPPNETPGWQYSPDPEIRRAVSRKAATAKNRQRLYLRT